MSKNPFKLTRFEIGGLSGSNCYLLVDSETNDGYIFDPGFDDPRLYDFIKDNKINLKKILLTHGHYDHIGAVQKLKDLTGAEVVISKKDAKYLENPDLNLSNFSGNIIELEPADVLVEDGDKINLKDDYNLTVLETPGHTPGSICFLGDGYMISGDLIFQDSIGRTDFEEGNYPDMVNSLKRIMQLPDSTLILPGHGEITSIEREKRYNPFLKSL